MIDEFRYDKTEYGDRVIAFKDVMDNVIVLGELNAGDDNITLHITLDDNPYLTLEQAHELSKILEYFSKTGRLPDEGDLK